MSTDDLRIGRIRPVLSPALVLEECPLSERADEVITRARDEAEAILKGHNDCLLVVVGPCSIHDPEAARDYARRLLPLIEQHRDQLQVIMRVYFEKPRTTVGWKGLINDPDLDNSFAINKGLRTARELLADLADQGVPAGTEFLDTISPQYIADCIAWGAIGARTTESQVHRELASGLSMPVGFKNGTGGGIQIAIDAIGAARGCHHFLSVTKHGVAAIVETTGNDSCHLILRGGTGGPNFDAPSVDAACQRLADAGLPTQLMIDCSHANSGKDHRRQREVAAELASRIAAGDRNLAAVMIESNLVEGNQKAAGSGLTYGQSITDACIGWEETEELLELLAGAVATRRGA